MSGNSSNKNERKQELIKSWSDWSRIIAMYKSPTDIQNLKEANCLQHFFMCMKLSCNFSTNDRDIFCKHQSMEHMPQKVRCVYCLGEFRAGKALTDHMVLMHDRRIYQCSLCLYRGSSRAHIKMHFLEFHQCKPSFYTNCSSQRENMEFHFERIDLGIPYSCSVKKCVFETISSAEFLAHHCDKHPAIDKIPCFRCNRSIALRVIVNHFHGHGLGNFECVYCVYGADDKNDILNHYCLNHADFAIRIYARVSSSVESKPLAQEANEDDSNMFKCLNSSYFGKFYCSVDGCGRLMNDLESFKDHIMSSHTDGNSSASRLTYSPSFSSNAQDLKSYGPKMFLCSVKGCEFVHTKKREVIKHRTKMHRTDHTNIIVAICKFRRTRERNKKMDELLQSQRHF